MVGGANRETELKPADVILSCFEFNQVVTEQHLVIYLLKNRRVVDSFQL